ncbi:L,D-transpeptidase family protein [Methylocaldum sp.]|uniref:L,D-transpeptidase family protein n=1 Tax=Methylocaldum sp. TaxID=1969727 RepID=UPI002D51EFD5|nr:L,D-transpeptidase family protein [Methylocaldum sp.]HYE34149.1 L,D-transpeptidase family protein [Methylocaldum sp.]
MFAGSSRSRLLLFLCLGSFLHGCALYFPGKKESLALPEPTVENVEHSRFVLGKDDSVMGQLATVKVEEGDSLPDVARHFGLGLEGIGEANPEVDLWAPQPGSRVILPMQFIVPDAPRKGVVVNLAAMRLFYFPKKKDGEVITYPVGIGREGRSTPTGEMLVERKTSHPTWHVPESIRRDHEKKGDPLPAVVSPGPDNPLGDYAMYLSRPSYLIHGTNKPYGIGLRASNGCVRLYPENIETLYRDVPVKTPVRIVNQPYLVGWRDGELYLEAHEPHDELNAKQLKKNLIAELKKIEKKQGRKLDWPRVEQIMSEGRGIPVPVFENSENLDRLVSKAVALKYPDELYGQPKTPAMTDSGWYITALASGDELSAQRLAAVLNHQGPQIPARVMALDNGRFSVIAGPFKNSKATKAAAKRMKIDLDIAGSIVSPKERLSLK